MMLHGYEVRLVVPLPHIFSFPADCLLPTAYKTAERACHLVSQSQAIPGENIFHKRIVHVRRFVQRLFVIAAPSSVDGFGRDVSSSGVTRDKDRL